MSPEEITSQEFNELCSEKGVYKISGSSMHVKVILHDLSCLVCSSESEGFTYYFFADIKAAETAFPKDL